MRSASRGDGVAFEELVRALAPDVFGYLAGMLGDVHEAEDALEETFVRVARSSARYEPGTSIRTWILGIARRVAADLRPTPSAAPGPLPTEPGEDVVWARRALRALPVEDRELIVCREVLGWDVRTIAGALGMEEAEVIESLAGAREMLRIRMNEAV